MDRVINVRSFGAHPDECPEQNVAAFQQALDCAEGRQLRIPSGEYNLNTGLIQRKAMRIEGDALAGTVLNFTHAGPHGLLVEPDCPNFNSSWADFSITAPNCVTAFKINTPTTGFLADFVIERVAMRGGGGFHADNTGTGEGYFCGRIRDCSIYNGAQFWNCGDSISVLDTKVHGRGIGILAKQRAGARQFVLDRLNVTASQECVYLLEMYEATVSNVWMETPSWACNYNGQSNALLYIANGGRHRIEKCTIQPLASMAGSSTPDGPFTPARWGVMVAGDSDHNAFEWNSISTGTHGHLSISASTVNKTYVPTARQRYAGTPAIHNAGTGTIFE